MKMLKLKRVLNPFNAVIDIDGGETDGGTTPAQQSPSTMYAHTHTHA